MKDFAEAGEDESNPPDSAEIGEEGSDGGLC